MLYRVEAFWGLRVLAIRGYRVREFPVSLQFGLCPGFIYLDPFSTQYSSS